ncbi:MAG: hypothetical protein ACDS79_12805 [Enterobacteriaceae bacterium]
MITPYETTFIMVMFWRTHMKHPNPLRRVFLFPLICIEYHALILTGGLMAWYLDIIEQQVEGRKRAEAANPALKYEDSDWTLHMHHIPLIIARQVCTSPEHIAQLDKLEDTLAKLDPMLARIDRAIFLQARWINGIRSTIPHERLYSLCCGSGLKEVAYKAGLSLGTLHNLVNGTQRITVENSFRLGFALNRSHNDPMWAELQLKHDLRRLNYTPTEGEQALLRHVSEGSWLLIDNDYSDCAPFKRLQFICERFGISIRQLAHAANIPEPTMRRIYHGKKPITVAIALKLGFVLENDTAAVKWWAYQQFNHDKRTVQVDYDDLRRRADEYDYGFFETDSLLPRGRYRRRRRF